MAQVKIYALNSLLDRHRAALSSAIHQAIMSALEYPAEKRFHRFIGLETQDFIYPEDRSKQYIILEISLFEGRSTEAKKALIKALYCNIGEQLNIAPQDIEITLFETPKENWGIRGLPGDELALGYKVDV